MSSSNCCFLTCIQASQEAGQVVWDFHLFQNFPQFIVIHTVKGFSIVKGTMVSVHLPSDALSQHLPSYLGFSYLGRGVSLHGCSSKVQRLLLTLDEGYLLRAAPPDLERGVAPLSPPVPAQLPLLGRGVAPLRCAPDLRRGVAPFSRRP